VPQPPRTARGERTREALRRAAQVRFLAQGVDATSAEQIAADAGVSLRTFYRHFTSKHELLFGDYDASLAWFRSALAARPPDEPVTDSVLAAIYSFPFDREAMYAIAALRTSLVERSQVERHIQAVQAELALEVEQHLLRQHAPADADARFEITVTARCIGAAIFAAVDTWMQGDHADLDGLAHLTELALSSLADGIVPRVAQVAKLT
jgi:AcrR family transcriptional regulator